MAVRRAGLEGTRSRAEGAIVSPSGGALPAARPSFAWSHPSAEVRASAFGELERREGLSLRETLAELRGGPWFGFAAFDGTGWPGFPPLRFFRPATIGKFGDTIQISVSPTKIRMVSPNFRA